MTIRPDTDDLIGFLNGLLDHDRYAVQELMGIRVACNEAMANHPTVQVAAHPHPHVPPGQFRTGILGILNGYAGVFDNGPRAGWGPITAVYEDGRLVRFERTVEG
ncbi:hypothetical protein TSH58p_17585 [Azospirillum sp. TSH58]|uniref:hypothetical protein n=1 Tax=Azospirillum sp. TSH58 TaxID=664962 RepID=UPI000D602643|nr:hypothetical protein [Azospirillum sp. TSH58]AWJ85176.1 hypothetical protein TSH58p_17585 [Azospirillum sp. TSH58]PWC80847.1 hypothetical protein TSH58_00980 [Azospirillum sp. TSH58]